MTLTTRTPTAPRKGWTCCGVRPVTGLPKGPDGRLLLVWEWQAPRGEAAPPEPDASPAPVRRGLAQFAGQSELPL